MASSPPVGLTSGPAPESSDPVDRGTAEYYISWSDEMSELRSTISVLKAMGHPVRLQIIDLLEKVKVV